VLKYTDFPGTAFEETGIFNVFVGGTGDYYIQLSDGEKEITFRYCINGGFEHRYPETTKAIANLFDAFEKEVKE